MQVGKETITQTGKCSGFPLPIALILIIVMIDRYLRQLSKLMLFPNLAYNSTFKASISSRMVLSLLSIVETDSSILAVDEPSISCTSGNGTDINVSPILYLGLHQQEPPHCRDPDIRDFVFFINQLQFIRKFL